MTQECKELMPRPARYSRASPPADSIASPALTLPPRSVQLNHPVNEAYVCKPLALRLSDGFGVAPLVCKDVGGYPVSSMCRCDAVGLAVSWAG